MRFHAAAEVFAQAKAAKNSLVLARGEHQRDEAIPAKFSDGIASLRSQ